MSLLTTHTEDMREFVEGVRRRAELASYEEAHQLSRATLLVLGQTVSGGEAQQLAQWLPEELAAELASQRGQASAFDKANFLEKVGGEIYSVDTERIEPQVGAVLNAVRAAAPGDELADTIAQLPPELSAMFGPGVR